MLVTEWGKEGWRVCVRLLEIHVHNSQRKKGSESYFWLFVKRQTDLLLCSRLEVTTNRPVNQWTWKKNSYIEKPVGTDRYFIKYYETVAIRLYPALRKCFSLVVGHACYHK